jgi:hypothetical protein
MVISLMGEDHEENHACRRKGNLEEEDDRK